MLFIHCNPAERVVNWKGDVEPAGFLVFLTGTAYAERMKDAVRSVHTAFD
jgi:predicted RNA-binding protein with TRAM domain